MLPNAKQSYDEYAKVYCNQVSDKSISCLSYGIHAVYKCAESPTVRVNGE